MIGAWPTASCPPSVTSSISCLPARGTGRPNGHLALFCFDVVDELDLSGFYERYRSDGLGRAAHERSVMVSVLLYA